MKKIDNYRGEYDFLSNFYEADIVFDGLLYKNNEAAFQSAKCLTKSDRGVFCNMSPSEAKRAGRHVELRKDWENVKEGIMYNICLDKFTRHPSLKMMLLQTGDAELIEGNTWGDKEWGMVNGEGKNKLGKILMRIREELMNEHELGNTLFGNGIEDYTLSDRSLVNCDEWSTLLEMTNSDFYGIASEWDNRLDKVNSRGGYENDTFAINPYWWGDENAVEEIAKPNFLYKPTGFIIKWYKYPFRDATMNEIQTNEEIKEIWKQCIASVKMDIEEN